MTKIRPRHSKTFVADKLIEHIKLHPNQATFTIAKAVAKENGYTPNYVANVLYNLMLKRKVSRTIAWKIEN